MRPSHLFPLGNKGHSYEKVDALSSTTGGTYASSMASAVFSAPLELVNPMN
jgi:hypothetical protein